MNLLNTFLLCCLTLCFGATALNAQNVNIPDANFKAYLVGNAAINTNGDGEIQVAEATAFTDSIECPYLNIADMTGLEVFVNITYLRCGGNTFTNIDLDQNINLIHFDCSNSGGTLSSLDVSNNTLLTELYFASTWISTIDLSNNTMLRLLQCSSGALSTLDLSNNTALEEVYCNAMNLTSLNINNNPLLEILNCSHNSITNLDISNSVSLIVLNARNNQLYSLNIRNGNNSNFTYFNALTNPNLTCIEVDDSTYSITNWTNIDTTATFNTNCSIYNNTNKINQTINPTVYPNPTTKEITLDFGNFYQEANIQVTNLTGQTVLNKTVENDSTTRLELEGAAGVYFVKIETEGSV